MSHLWMLQITCLSLEYRQLSLERYLNKHELSKRCTAGNPLLHLLHKRSSQFSKTRLLRLIQLLLIPLQGFSSLSFLAVLSQELFCTRSTTVLIVRLFYFGKLRLQRGCGRQTPRNRLRSLPWRISSTHWLRKHSIVARTMIEKLIAGCYRLQIKAKG